ncbi:MAG: threonine/serine exporter family protein [Actinomycetales bacterium]|nr:MAG: threonine/serine exporter family protein [Actinomycetales bacterium]
MTDSKDVQRTLDLALRIGEMLLSNGAGAADVTATMASVTHHLGLRQTLVDVTFTSLTLSHQESVDDLPIVMRRHVTHREVDYADLTAVDLLVTALLTGEIDRDEAAARVARISSTGHPRPRWAITASWGLTGAGVALLLGGDWIVLAVAAVAGAAIEVLQRRIERLRLPFFYSQVAGALLATLIAVAVAATPAEVNPSLVVTAAIIMLLAGLGFIGAIQDALTGFSITANAFALSAYSPKRIVVPIGLLAAVTSGAYAALTQADVGRPAAAGVAAFAVGFVGYSVARRFRVPPLVVVVSCIVPLLPGLSIFRALSLLAGENLLGLLWMITAGGVAVALASGVLLGQYVAQPLGREARRLERRLAGPRLVGPLRAAAARRQKD